MFVVNHIVGLEPGMVIKVPGLLDLGSCYCNLVSVLAR